MKSIIIDGVEYTLIPVPAAKAANPENPAAGSHWIDTQTGGVYVVVKAPGTPHTWTLINVSTGTHYSHWSGWGGDMADFVPFKGTISATPDATA